MLKKNSVIEIDGNDYVLKEQIGNGGSSTVWLAESNDKQYAVKFINSDSESKTVRFENEISFCKNTNHRLIVKVVAEGRFNNKPCYVMPYYVNTFRDVINKEEDADTLIKYLLNICRAIKYIHGKQVIHRDIKPENILVSEQTLVLADFGISHFKSYEITKENELLANRNYLAPEQKLKNNAINIQQAADVYALGLIINECFTKQNPAGSQFKLIADSYPILLDLDSLVENMIRQNYEERLSVDAVYTELKFIRGKFKKSFLEINSFLREQGRPDFIKKSTFNRVLKRASEDIFIGKYLFCTHSSEEFEKYNHNWHMKIGYSADEFLYNLYIQEQIFSVCKSKFEYESNVYRVNNWYNTLDLANNSEHKLLYQRMASTLSKYKFQNRDESLLDLSGTILKYFSSCVDYHCKEILNRVVDIERIALENLKNAPIIWIVARLRYGIKENLEFLLNGIDGLAGKYEFNFIEHITINWDRTGEYISNHDDDRFFDAHYLEKKELERNILAIAQNKWNIKSNMLNLDYYSIKFQTYNQYKKFRRYALELSKPYYIFEGDVLGIFSNPILIGGMIELKLSRVFDIHSTMAKIVGLRNILE